MCRRRRAVEAGLAKGGAVKLSEIHWDETIGAWKLRVGSTYRYVHEPKDKEELAQYSFLTMLIQEESRMLAQMQALKSTIHQTMNRIVQLREEKSEDSK